MQPTSFAMLTLALTLAVFAGVATPAEATGHSKTQTSSVSKRSLLTSGQLSTEDLRAQLISELRPGSEERLSQWKEAMGPMYAALPKNANGNLEHAAARYALHRAFMARRGWSMAGLEPTADVENASLPVDSLKEWVPSELLDTIEEVLGT